MLRTTAALGLSAVALAGAAASPTAAPQVPDMFTCTEPARLATGTFEYQIDGDTSGRPVRRTVSRVDAGGQALVRLQWLTSTPSEHITDLEASALTPLRTSSTTTYATGTKASARLEIIGGEIRGNLTPASSTPIAISTGGRPVVFGPYVVELLAAAVNWDRCPSVRTRTVTVQRLPEIVLTRSGTATLPFQGKSVPAIEIDVKADERPRKVWITQAAPHFPLKFTTSLGDSSFSLVSRSQ